MMYSIATFRILKKDTADFRNLYGVCVKFVLTLSGCVYDGLDAVLRDRTREHIFIPD